MAQETPMKELDVKKAVCDMIKQAESAPFVRDGENARKVLAKAFHSILRNEGYNIFLDDIHQYLQVGKDIKKVY